MKTDFRAFLYGQDYVNKMNDFNLGIEKLEEKYLDYLKTIDQFKSISKYFNLLHDGVRNITLNIPTDSELPPALKEEIQDLFKSIWR